MASSFPKMLVLFVIAKNTILNMAPFLEMLPST